MPKVFVLQESHDKDVSSASEYGELEVVIPSGRRRAAFQLWDRPELNAPLLSRIQRILSKFSPGDFLILMGDPVLIFAAGAALARLGIFRVNLLKWDRHRERYTCVEMDLWRGNLKGLEGPV